MSEPRYAIIDRLTPEQRARVAGHRWRIDQDPHATRLVCINDVGACPLGCALGVDAVIGAMKAADALAGREPGAPMGGQHLVRWEKDKRSAYSLMGSVDSGEPGEDRTDVVLAAFRVTADGEVLA